MEFTKHSDDCVEVFLTPQEVESAVKQFICKCYPEYGTGWIIGAKYNMGAAIFSCTKDDDKG